MPTLLPWGLEHIVFYVIDVALWICFFEITLNFNHFPTVPLCHTKQYTCTPWGPKVDIFCGQYFACFTVRWLWSVTSDVAKQGWEQGRWLAAWSTCHISRTAWVWILWNYMKFRYSTVCLLSQHCYSKMAGKDKRLSQKLTSQHLMLTSDLHI